MGLVNREHDVGTGACDAHAARPGLGERARTGYVAENGRQVEVPQRVARHRSKNRQVVPRHVHAPVAANPRIRVLDAETLRAAQRYRARDGHLHRFRQPKAPRECDRQRDFGLAGLTVLNVAIKRRRIPVQPDFPPGKNN